MKYFYLPVYKMADNLMTMQKYIKLICHHVFNWFIIADQIFPTFHQQKQWAFFTDLFEHICEYPKDACLEV